MTASPFPPLIECMLQPQHLQDSLSFSSFSWVHQIPSPFPLPTECMLQPQHLHNSLSFFYFNWVHPTPFLPSTESLLQLQHVTPSLFPSPAESTWPPLPFLLQLSECTWLPLPFLLQLRAHDPLSLSSSNWVSTHNSLSLSFSSWVHMTTSSFPSPTECTRLPLPFLFQLSICCSLNNRTQPDGWHRNEDILTPGQLAHKWHNFDSRLKNAVQKTTDQIPGHFPHFTMVFKHIEKSRRKKTETNGSECRSSMFHKQPCTRLKWTSIIPWLVKLDRRVYSKEISLTNSVIHMLQQKGWRASYDSTTSKTMLPCHLQHYSCVQL